MDVILEEEDLPKEDFTETQMRKVWGNFVSQIENKGKYNFASILQIDTQKLVGTTIHLEFQNTTNKIEVEREKHDLLRYLKQELNNFDISLRITVNEDLEKNYAYSPTEKYEKLKEKNNRIELLHKTCDLDI